MENGETAQHVWRYPELHSRVMVYATALVLVLVNTASADAFMPHGLVWSALSPTTAVIAGLVMTLGLVLGGFALVRRRSASESTPEENRAPRVAVSGWRTGWRMLLLLIKTGLAFFIALFGFLMSNIAGVATGLWVFAVILFLRPRALFQRPPPDARRDANRRVLGALLVFWLGVVIVLNGATVNLGPGGRGPWIGQVPQELPGDTGGIDKSPRPHERG